MAIRVMLDDLDLPPPYRAVVLREHRDAFAHACEIAALAGAGTLVWVRRFDCLETAVVLEPEEPLETARRAIYAVLNAAGDALATYCPPEKPLLFAWPDTILLDGGIIGGVRLAWPEETAERDVPDWLVAGLVLRLILPHQHVGAATGHALDVRLSRGTSLDVEGVELLDAASIIGSFARHLMMQFDRWQEAGFESVGQAFVSRLGPELRLDAAIDGAGDLVARIVDGVAVTDRVGPRSLRDALREPHWRDPSTGEPWL